MSRLYLLGIAAGLALLGVVSGAVGVTHGVRSAHTRPNLVLLNERSVDHWVVVDVESRRRTHTTFSASQVVVSPDGSYVALRGPDWEGLDIATIDGFRQYTVVRSDGSHYITSLDWSPSGDRLVYAQSTRTAPETGGIYVVRRDGGRRHQIADVPAGEVRWAPNGSLIAFITNTAGRQLADGVYVMRADGSELRRLESGIGHEPLGPQPISWSSDGRSLLSVHSRGGAASAAFVIDVRTGKKSFVPRVGAGVFAPRGRRILVARGYALYFARLLVGQPAQPTSLVATDATTPVWARDGRRIAYTTADGLWVFNLATRERHRVLAWRLRPVEAKFGLAWATAYP